MEKWENDLRKINKEPVPKVVELGIQKALKKIPRKRNNRGIYAFVSAALLFVTLISGALYSPVFASTLKSMPIIGSIFAQVDTADAGLKTSVLDGIAVTHGKEVMIEGKQVMIGESMYDGSRLAISFIVEAKSREEATSLLSRLRYKINDIPFNGWGGISIDVNEKELVEGRFAGVYMVGPNKKLSDEFKLSVKTDNGFSTIPVELKGDYLVKDIRKQKQEDGIYISYEEFVKYPTSTVLTFTEEQTLDSYLELENQAIRYAVLDGEGKEVPLIFGTGQGGEYINQKIQMRYTYILPVELTEVTIQPYIENISNGEKVRDLKELKIVIDLVKE